MSLSDERLYDAKKQLLTTALGDIKGSIHANDQKVSAALVVNGLLLTSVVTVVTHTEHIYKKAHSSRDAGIVLLSLALAAFIASVGWLLWAMKPYRPKGIANKIQEDVDKSDHAGRYQRVFFPVKEDLKAETPFTKWRGRIELLELDGIVDELTAEILKLADILRTESDRAKWGYLCLAVEGLLVTAFFVLVAAVAI
jgi:hypothetical protein